MFYCRRKARIERVFLRFLWIGLLVHLGGSVGCLEPNKGTDNQIVVIGNGSQWASTLIVDVESETHRESMVLSKSGLSPVSSQIWSGKRLNQLDFDSLSIVPWPENFPLFLDWIAPYPISDFILKADQISKDRVVKEQHLYESGMNGSTRRTDLEEIPFSSEVPPLFLSDGSIILVDSNHQLYWRDSQQRMHWIAAEIHEVLSDGKRSLFLRSGKGWLTISVGDLVSDLSLDSASRLFQRGLIYQAQNQVVYVLCFDPSVDDSFHLKPRLLYEWMNQTRSFRPVWKNSIEDRSLTRLMSLTFLKPSQFEAFGIHASDTLEGEREGVLSLGLKGVDFLPTRSTKVGDEISVGRSKLVSFRKGMSKIDSLETCERGPLLSWNCRVFDLGAYEFVDLVVTDKDEIFGLSSDGLYRLNFGSNFEKVLVATLNGARGQKLRFMKVPTQKS